MSKKINLVKFSCKIATSEQNIFMRHYIWRDIALSNKLKNKKIFSVSDLNIKQILIFIDELALRIFCCRKKERRS